MDPNLLISIAVNICSFSLLLLITKYQLQFIHSFIQNADYAIHPFSTRATRPTSRI